MSVVDLAIAIIRAIHTIKNEAAKMEATSKQSATLTSRLELLLPSVDRLAAHKAREGGEGGGGGECGDAGESGTADERLVSVDLLVGCHDFMETIRRKIVEYNSRSRTKRVIMRNKDSKDFKDLETQLERYIKDLHFDLAVKAEARRIDDMKEMKSLIERLGHDIKASRSNSSSDLITEFETGEDSSNTSTRRKKTPHSTSGDSLSSGEVVLHATKLCGHTISCILSETPAPPSPFFSPASGAFLLAASYDAYRLLRGEAEEAQGEAAGQERHGSQR